MTKRPNPGDFLSPDEWVITKVLPDMVYDINVGPFHTIQLIEGPALLLALEKDGYTAVIMTNGYMGRAQVSPVVPVGKAVSDERIIRLTMILFLILIVGVFIVVWGTLMMAHG